MDVTVDNTAPTWTAVALGVPFDGARLVTSSSVLATSTRNENSAFQIPRPSTGPKQLKNYYYVKRRK